MIKPSAIKGPKSFGPQDGELFLRLGREQELSELLWYVLDDKVGLIVLMGASGAGKTSLLRSGLHHILEKQQQPPVPCTYWEALPTDPTDHLLHAVREAFGPSKAPLTLDLLAKINSNHRVIILDQLEQLNPTNPSHVPIFQLLHKIGSRKPPFRVTWIVSFRREFDPVWRDFEIAHSDLRFQMISLRLFSRDRAGEVLATLAETVDLSLDNALLDELLSSSEGERGISPVDLGIGMLVLHKLAGSKKRSSLSVNDYRFAGGSDTLLASYFLDSLSSLIEGERQAVLKALLLLIDLPNNQRVAEGRHLADLAHGASLPLPRLKSYLDDLVDARLIEKIDAHYYRLEHERLIEPLRTLTGQLLADADRAKLVFDDGFSRWLRNSRPSTLISGSDLQLVLNHKNHLLLANPKAIEFLRLSQTRHKRKWNAVFIGLAIAIIGTGSIWYAVLRSNDRSSLLSLGLPPDLADRQEQLKSLHLSRPTNSLSWLRAPLTELEISGEAMRTFPKLPKTLVRLTINGGDPSLFSEIPALPNLEELSFRNVPIKNISLLRRLPRLRKLEVSLASDVRTDALAPLSLIPTLEELTVTFQSSSRQLPHLSLPFNKNLRTISISGGANPFATIRGLTATPEPHLTRLSLMAIDRRFRLCPIGGRLFPELSELKLSEADSLLDLSCFPRLKSLDLPFIPGLEPPHKYDALVKTASTYCFKSQACGSNTLDLPRLKHLRVYLQINFMRGETFSMMANLEQLHRLSVMYTFNLFGNDPLFRTRRLPNLVHLDLDGVALPSLSYLSIYPSLEELHLSSVTIAQQPIRSLKDFPRFRRLRVLDLQGAGLPDLRELPRLPMLRTIDLRGNPLKSLEGLPSTVTELYI